jgi:SAM-dependent methyltransferase
MYHDLVSSRLSLFLLGPAALFAQLPASRTIHASDLPPAIARRFDRDSFDARIQAIERDTERRESAGELEHLIYYALQSRRFTSLAPIEPAWSAREFVRHQTVPAAVRARLDAFLQALDRPAEDARLRYFADLLTATRRSRAFLEGEYRRVMGFLYDKEFLHRENVYQTRGHSTDTQVEANYAVWAGLSVLKSLAADTRMQRILIVGPGLDFAPRTALDDSRPPQSFQPYAVADALLGLGMARRGQFLIDCADINARVIDFLRTFPAGPRTLELYSGGGDAEYRRYFSSLGGAIGTKNGSTIHVDVDVARAIRAGRRNIMTDRWEAAYDLAIATNVLVYFSSDELALAVANIGAMLRPGGWFLHNELRPEVDELAAAAGLEAVQARTVRIAEGRTAPLFDSFALYRKR